MKKFLGSPKKVIVLILVVLLLVLAVAAIVIKSTLINGNEAESYALKDAGLDDSDVSGLSSNLDFDDGFFQYEVEFYCQGVEYEYKVRAKDGDILSRDYDGNLSGLQNSKPQGGSGVTEAPQELSPTDTAGSEPLSTPAAGENTPAAEPTKAPDGNSSELISLDAAKKAALDDAGVSEADAEITKAKLDTDDYIQVYDIEFYADDKEYEYEIAAADGRVVDKSVETVKNRPTAGVKPTAGAGNETGVSVDEAKAIALKDAKVAEADAQIVKAKPDTDDNIKVYDIEFYAGDKEYEYEIAVADGRIIDKSVETAKNRPASGGSVNVSDGISADEAKAIALKSAGFTEAEVSYLKTEQDFDDGRQVYDVSFYNGNVEYEYEIDVATGSIIDSSIDYD